MGNPNYGSARGSAPLAPLYVGWLPYSIHFVNTTLHCRSLQWTISQIVVQRHSKLLTGDMAVGMPWLFMAWGSALCLCKVGELSRSFSGQCRKSHTYLQPIWHNTNSSYKQILGIRFSQIGCKLMSQSWRYPFLVLCKSKAEKCLDLFPFSKAVNSNLKIEQPVATRVCVVYSWREVRCDGARSCYDIPRALS